MKSASILETKTNKFLSPEEFLTLLKKNEKNRQWILKQLQQLQIDVKLLENYSLQELYRYCEEIFKSTYSIKYLGINNNEMGIISRRLDPFKDSNFSLKGIQQSPYVINKFFYPKPLKVCYKQKKNQNLNCRNLEDKIITAFSLQNLEAKHQSKKSRKNLSGCWKNMSQKEKEKNVLYEKGKENIRQRFRDVTSFLEGKKKKDPLTFSYSRFLKNGMLLIKQKN